MTKVEKVRYPDVVCGREYIKGFLYAMLAYDRHLDDPEGILDGAIDGVLVDAFQAGWRFRKEQEEM